MSGLMRNIIDEVDVSARTPLFSASGSDSFAEGAGHITEALMSVRYSAK